MTGRAANDLKLGMAFMPEVRNMDRQILMYGSIQCAYMAKTYVL